MGQFKPMVKMMTDEPSVILKLKKGGKVASKATGQSEAFKSMASNNAKMFESPESGMAPKKPSMAERRKAMNPNLYAKGGKVAHKQMGGMMPATPGMVAGSTSPAPAPMQAMGRAALAGMPPAQRNARAMAVRRALTGMKKGGSADCSALEKELKHHEAMSASKAHGKAGGGKVSTYAKTKMDTAHKDSARGTGEVKMGKPGGYNMGGKAMGGYAMGGSIMGNEKAYENTKMSTAGKGKTGGTTGGVKMGNAGGYKSGGKAMKYAAGGEVDKYSPMTKEQSDAYKKSSPMGARSDTAAQKAKTSYAKKMTSYSKEQDNQERSFLRKAAGGTIKDGNWENRPANTSKPGVKNTTTGEVKNGNGGGFKMGGRASKKAFATGGQVVDDGKAVKMPRHAISRPVANSLQSGTFKKGGKVKFADGGSTDMSKGAYDAHYANEKAENESMRNMILDPLKSMGRHIKRSFDPEGYFKGDERKRLFEVQAADNFRKSMAEKTPGAVTKTEKSVTVAPATKKRGGRAC